MEQERKELPHHISVHIASSATALWVSERSRAPGAG